jgi:hypothetical protein
VGAAAVSDVCVCTVIYGHRNYFRAGRQAVRSVLARSDFDVFVAYGPGPEHQLPDSPRVRAQLLRPPVSGDRAMPFLLKFLALESCLRLTDAEWILLLDADAMLVSDLHPSAISRALGAAALGMVEQTGITGSGMTRGDFLQHYVTHALAWFAPGTPAPGLERFRFYNSGVVLGRRGELERLTTWALDTMHRAGKDHRIGRHMIADQDYFQYWTNTLFPSSCVQLPWNWNHCRHWDPDFPRSDAYILHFSNFCRGPSLHQVWRMGWRNYRLEWSRRLRRSRTDTRVGITARE